MARGGSAALARTLAPTLRGGGLSSARKLRHTYAKASGQPTDIFPRRVPFAPLDPADVGPVQTTLTREFLLRPAELLSQRSYRATKRCLVRLAAGHRTTVATQRLCGQRRCVLLSTRWHPSPCSSSAARRSAARTSASLSSGSTTTAWSNSESRR